MRKFFLVVAALGMLATSCTKDDAAVAGGESLVSFTIDSPELATRYGEGTTATNLEWAFYDENGVKLDEICGSISDFSGSHSFTVALVEGRQYTALFWASAPAAPYVVDWANKKMSVTTAGLTANNEAYDAFYKYTAIDQTKKVHKVELTRPFAQINIATADTEDARKAGVVVAATKVTVENAYKTLDLVNGEVSEPASFEFGWAAKATGTAKTSYDMLAMNYVLVNERELVNVTMEASENTDGSNAITRTYSTVPVQRNYQTFIIGKLLTTTNEFDITTNPGFDGEEEYDGTHNVSVNGTNYNSFLEALNAAQDGDEISLNTDLTLAVGQTRSDATNYYAVIEGKDVTINLNGKNIFAKVPDVTKNSGIFCVKKGAKLTIKGEGNIHLKTSKAVNCLATFINNDAGTVDLVGDINWTIDALEYPDALIPCFVDNNSNVGNATLNIYAGTFTFHRNMFRNFANAAGHNGYATVATINIYGGTFNGKADDAGAIWNQKPSSTTPEGAGVVNVYGGTFNNVTIDNDFTTGVEEKTPQQAFNEAAAAANGEPIYLAPAEGGYTLPSFGGDDINVVGVGEGVVLNMQDKTPGVNADVNIENVEIVFSNNNYKGFQHTGAEYYKNCTIVGQPFLYGENVVFDNCTFEQTSANAYNVWTYGAKNVTFNGCTFNSAGKSVLVYHEGGISQNVTFNDCELNASAPAEGKAAVEIDSSFPNGGTGHYTININNTEANGFALGSVSFNSLWNEKKGDNCTVYVDGVEQGKTVVESNEALNAAVAAGHTSISLAAGDYTMPEPDLRGKTLTIVGTKDVVIDATAVDARDQFVTGATLSFEGVTVNFGTANYMGFANCASLTYKDCNINGLQFLFNDTTFENCKFNSNGAEHSVWTYGSKNVSFEGCEFTYGDRCVNCYSDNDVVGGKQTVNFTNCTFTTENTASAGAVEINSCFFSVGIEVELTGCTAPAYGQMAYVSPWDSTNGVKTTININ